MARKRWHLTVAGTACGSGLEITVCASVTLCSALGRVLVPGVQVLGSFSLPVMVNMGKPKGKANTGTMRQSWKVGGAQALSSSVPDAPPSPQRALRMSLPSGSPSGVRMTLGPLSWQETFTPASPGSYAENK